MWIPADKLASIVEKAETLYERLAKEIEAPPGGPGENGVSKLAAERLEKWCSIVADGDWEKFSRRLVLDGWELASVCRKLDDDFCRSRDWSPWADVLQECLQAVADCSEACTPESDMTAADHVFLDADNPVPFEELFIPFVLFARRKLRQFLGGRAALLSEAALGQLERSLLHCLSSLSWQALDLEFSAYRSVKRALQPFAAVSRARDGQPSKRLYQEFVREMLAGRLLDFLAEYPVLAKLWTLALENWVQFHREWTARLEADLPLLSASFFSGRRIGKVAAIDADMSDFHQGGKTVLILTFQSGDKLVYKPKNLTMDAAYFRLLDWCNRNGAPLDQKVVRILDRGDYGWMEYVSHTACSNQEEVGNFYRRAGALLCLVYLLEGTDFHFENLLAAGEYPVLIDLETLFQPRAEPEELFHEPDGHLAAIRQYLFSVYRTSFLPQPFKAMGRDVEWSGLGGGIFDSVREVPQVRHVNTDEMVLARRPAAEPSRKNMPTLYGEPVPFGAYQEALIDGFNTMYRFCLSRKKELGAEDGPLSAFRGALVRFVFRATYVYGAILKKSLHPDCLRHGIERSIQLEMNHRALLVDPQPLPTRYLLREEVEMMERLDIPYFVTTTDSRAIYVPSRRRYVEVFPRSAYDRVMDKVRSLSEADRETQVRFIRYSLLTRTCPDAHLALAGPVADRGTEKEADVSAVPDSKRWLAGAEEIARMLTDLAVVGHDGSMTWIGPAVRKGRYHVSLMETSLYGGNGGIALFFAALADVSQKTVYQDLAYASLKLFRATLTGKHRRRFLERADLHGLNGTVSMLYAMARIGKWFDDMDLLQETEALAAFVTEERVRKGKSLGLLHGTAGTLLSFLTLYEVCGEPSYLRRAIACGEHLLAHRRTNEAGHFVWSEGTAGTVLDDGFADGAVGVAYALLRLHRHTGETVFRQAAVETIDSVRGRRGGRTVADGNLSWCHGASGFGMGYLAAWRAGEAAYRDDAEAVVRAVGTPKQDGVHHLCCGMMGHVDFLIEASRPFARPDWMGAAARKAAAVCKSWQETGTFVFTPDRNVQPPGLWRGLAGIGYEWLRLMAPEQVPSVLLLE